MSAARKWLSQLALAATVVALLHSGLSPYDLGRRNAVRWSVGGPGLIFGSGIAFTDRPLHWEAAREAHPLSVEAWVVPYERVRGSRTILGLVDDQDVPPFEITAGEDSIGLRYRLPGDARTVESRMVAFQPGLERDRRVHLAVTSGPAGTRLYVDGSAPDELRTRYPLLPGRDELSARLVLGNSPQGMAAWSGEFRGLAIFDRWLEEDDVRAHAERVRAGGIRDLLGEPGLRALYEFKEAGGRRVHNLIGEDNPIQIPRRFQVLRRGVLDLAPLQPWGRRAIAEILRNLVGFVPLGFIAAYVSGSIHGAGLRSAFWRACVACLALSLSIELGQVFLPSRHSSAVDLAFNATGGLVGAALCTWLRWARRARARSLQTVQPDS
jgi:hypothetical protein